MGGTINRFAVGSQERQFPGALARVKSSCPRRPGLPQSGPSTFKSGGAMTETSQQTTKSGWTPQAIRDWLCPIEQRQQNQARLRHLGITQIRKILHLLGAQPFYLDNHFL